MTSDKKKNEMTHPNDQSEHDASAPSAGWVKIYDAPLNEMGHVWSPSFPDRVDATGSVFTYSSGERGVYSNWHGMEFTLWHPFPPHPQSQESGE